jgi:hypothetical protein
MRASTTQAPAPRIVENLTVRTRAVIQLGPLRIEIRSNESHFVGLQYLPRLTCTGDVDIDYVLTFCNLAVDAPWPMPDVLQASNTGYRSSRFASGYYITDHFGPPAYITNHGSHYWLFAVDFEPIFWPYLVKFLLTIHSIRCSTLHLKAAGFALGGAGTLLVGRGGSGKTVLLAQMCRRGAYLLSNTHTLVSRDAIIAVRSSMRVRNDAVFSGIIGSRALPTGIKSGEYLVDPVEHLGWQHCASASLRNICLVEFRAAHQGDIRALDRNILFDYMEQFSVALNVYGLKEDILEYLGEDIDEFSRQMRRTREALHRLIEHSNCHYVTCDVTNPDHLRAFYAALGYSHFW